MKLTNRIANGARQVDVVAGGIEAIVLALTSRAAGWVACVPTILLTSRSCEVIFSLTPMEALTSAVALELVGQSTTKTWLRAREWNRTKLATDAPASERLTLALTVGYFVIDFALIAILQVPKALVDPVYYAALLFPLAQVISTVITAERAAQFGREVAADEEAAKRREARAEHGAKKEREKVEQVEREEWAEQMEQAAIEKTQIAPTLLPLPFTPRQSAQIEQVVAVHAANEAATLHDLRLDGLIGSDTTASRARKRAIAGGYLVKTAVGFSPNGQ